MKAWKDDKGIVAITKEEWDSLWKVFHPTPCKIDYRKLSQKLRGQMKCLICNKCGGIGVMDYDFKKKEWCTSCRECRTRLD